MSRWILDTDHVSLALQGHPLITARIQQYDTEVVTTVVTAQELFNGWVVRINDPNYVQEIVQLYERFLQTLNFLKGIQILTFDQAAYSEYKQLVLNPSLRKKRLQQDMKIAAVALSTDAIVVTRNQRDFSLVPNLRLENWTV
jgi:tRNA(fMet)-specific endonuclease VapC